MEGTCIDWTLVGLIGIICFFIGSIAGFFFALHGMRDIVKAYKTDMLEKHGEWWAKTLTAHCNELSLDQIYDFVTQFKVYDKGEIKSKEED